jgi:hypothetical protein
MVAAFYDFVRQDRRVPSLSIEVKVHDECEDALIVRFATV